MTPTHLVLGEADAPWLVLCHGMALDHRDLRPFGERMADAGWRVLLWDMPGHGGGAPPDDWGVPAMADALEALLDLLGIRSFAAVGFSFGGVVAQEVALRRPAACRALVAYACLSPRATGPLASPGLARLIVGVSQGLRPWATLRREFARRCAETAAARHAVERAMEPLGRRGFMAMTRSLLAGVSRIEGYRPAFPVLVVMGSLDSNRALVERAWAAAAPDAERRVVAGAGHCAHLDDPAGFEAAVTPFLSRHRGTPGHG